MGMVINTNVSSVTAQRHLAASRADMEQAMERLSSGQRINSAMDDAAGLTIAHSLDSKISSLNQAVRNANDGIALVQLAEGALDEVSAMLTRMKELATQSINGTYSTNDRTNLNLEFEQLTSEITRISENTLFNGISVINSTDTATFQVGDTSSDQISVTLQKVGSAHIGEATGFALAGNVAGGGTKAAMTIALARADVVATKELRVDIAGKTFTQEYLGTTGVAATDQDATVDALIAQIVAAGIADSTSNYDGTTIDLNNTTVETADIATTVDLYNTTANSSSPLSAMNIKNATNAGIALTTVDRAISDVDSYRANLGAIANRMEHASSNLMSRVEHQSSARSRIQDADYAVESANLAKAQVLQQAGTAMLAQANASTQNILSLLK
jgi:flagellin